MWCRRGCPWQFRSAGGRDALEVLGARDGRRRGQGAAQLRRGRPGRRPGLHPGRRAPHPSVSASSKSPRAQRRNDSVPSHHRASRRHFVRHVQKAEARSSKKSDRSAEADVENTRPRSAPPARRQPDPPRVRNRVNMSNPPANAADVAAFTASTAVPAKRIPPGRKGGSAKPLWRSRPPPENPEAQLARRWSASSPVRVKRYRSSRARG